MAKKTPTTKTVATLKHDEAKRKNIPTAEHQSVLQKNEQSPVRVNYPRSAAGLDDENTNRNKDLDQQLIADDQAAKAQPKRRIGFTP